MQDSKRSASPGARSPNSNLPSKKLNYPEIYRYLSTKQINFTCLFINWKQKLMAWNWQYLCCSLPQLSFSNLISRKDKGLSFSKTPKFSNTIGRLNKNYACRKEAINYCLRKSFLHAISWPQHFSEEILHLYYYGTRKEKVL